MYKTQLSRRQIAEGLTALTLLLPALTISAIAAAVFPSPLTPIPDRPLALALVQILANGLLFVAPLLLAKRFLLPINEKFLSWCGCLNSVNQYAFWIPSSGGAELHLGFAAIRDGATKRDEIMGCWQEALEAGADGRLAKMLPSNSVVKVQSPLCRKEKMEALRYTAHPPSKASEWADAKNGCRRVEKAARLVGRHFRYSDVQRENMKTVWKIVYSDSEHKAA